MTASQKVAQTTALSVLVSLYLEAVVAASSEEIETFLSPLASRSRVREVVNGLSATRQLGLISVAAQPLFHVAGSLPEFAEEEPVAADAESGARKRPASESREAGFERRPGATHEEGAGRKPFQRGVRSDDAVQRRARPHDGGDRGSRDRTERRGERDSIGNAAGPLGTEYLGSGRDAKERDLRVRGAGTSGRARGALPGREVEMLHFVRRRVVSGLFAGRKIAGLLAGDASPMAKSRLRRRQGRAVRAHSTAIVRDQAESVRLGRAAANLLGRNLVEVVRGPGRARRGSSFFARWRGRAWVPSAT